MNKKEARQLAVRALGELAEQLDRGLSDRLRQYMRVMRRFRAYSLGNTLLIMLQRPDATHVAGCRTWPGFMSGRTGGLAQGGKGMCACSWRRRRNTTCRC